MNSVEQHQRHTQIAHLEQKLEALAEALDAELPERIAEIRQTVSDERTHWLKLAIAERVYVDAADRRVTDNAVQWVQSVSLRIADFESLSFLGRLRWILTGQRH